MRRLLGIVAAAGVLTAGVSATLPMFAEPEPLPVLRNGADWTQRAPFSAGHLGSELLRPVLDRAWLVRGRVPGGAEMAPVVTRALLDLRHLTRPNGAVAAGPDGPWALAWPRDCSFVASAYAVSGHVEDAWAVLGFLGSVQGADGGFEARYLLSGAGPPDARPRQSDGAGWVLWAMDRTRGESGQRTVPASLYPLRDRAVGFILRLTDDGRNLPPVSPDYWEVRERRLTLGTAAPLAAGLDAAARMYAAEGLAGRATRIHAAAVRLRARIVEHFGPDYQRHGDSGGLDASVAMLMPPFATEDTASAKAWIAYPALALRRAGGIAPGVQWKQDGVSWTPETALVAYTAAASGRVDVARQWVDWLTAHRTEWGSLPEKVLPDGRPAGPAPLAWTSALVVLTEHELDVRRSSAGLEIGAATPDQ